MNIKNFEIEIIDLLLLGEFYDIESFIKKYCRLKPDNLIQNYSSKYCSLQYGDRIYLPENEEDTFIELQKFEKLIIYLKECECIELVPQNTSSDILPIFKIDPKNNLPQPYNAVLEIIHRNKDKKIIVLEELQKFRNRNYKTKEQYEYEQEKTEKKSIERKARIYKRASFWVHVVYVLIILIQAYFTIYYMKKSDRLQDYINKNSIGQDSTKTELKLNDKSDSLLK